MAVIDVDDGAAAQESDGDGDDTATASEPLAVISVHPTLATFALIIAAPHVTRQRDAAAMLACSRNLSEVVSRHPVYARRFWLELGVESIVVAPKINLRFWAPFPVQRVSFSADTYAEDVSAMNLTALVELGVTSSCFMKRRQQRAEAGDDGDAATRWTTALRRLCCVLPAPPDGVANVYRQRVQYECRYGFTDAVFAHMAQLTALRFAGPVGDGSFARLAPSLTSLRLDATPLSGGQPLLSDAGLRRLVNLTSLSLECCLRVTHAVLESTPRLARLRLVHCPRVCIDAVVRHMQRLSEGDGGGEPRVLQVSYWDATMRDAASVRRIGELRRAGVTVLSFRAHWWCYVAQ